MEPTAGARRAIRVMVVDDHPMWRDAVERDLAAAGFDVVAVAADGHQALARVPRGTAAGRRARPPDPRPQRRRGDRGGARAGPDRRGC